MRSLSEIAEVGIRLEEYRDAARYRMGDRRRTFISRQCHLAANEAGGAREEKGAGETPAAPVLHAMPAATYKRRTWSTRKEEGS
jgi:hypothetical protein